MDPTHASVRGATPGGAEVDAKAAPGPPADRPRAAPAVESDASLDATAIFLHHTGRTTLPEVMPDLSRGHACICLHSAGSNGAIFAPLLEALATSHSPLAFDQPGHGRSGGLDALERVEDAAALVEALCARLGTATPALVGHGTGGAIALEVARRGRLRPCAIVLIATPARWPGLGSRIEQLAAVTAGRARRDLSHVRCAPTASPEVVRRATMEELRTDPRAALGAWRAVQAWEQAHASTPRSVVATRAIVGEDESPALAASAAELASALGAGAPAVIPKAGHMVPLEQPEAVARAIESHLASVASTSAAS
jgi:3-oxoadipate enol-lactonase